MGQGLDGDQGLSTTMPPQAPAPPGGRLVRRTARLFRGRRRLQLTALLSAPLGWLMIAYLGSLAIMLRTAVWRLDAFSGTIERGWFLDNFRTLWQVHVYRTITLRTMGVAAAVTVTTMLLAFPIAFTMAKVVKPRTRAVLVMAVLLPLWSNYLVKVYSWRGILSENGILNSLLEPLGLRGPGFGLVATWLVMTYLWLPYMIIPIYAGLEKIPDSLLEASGDLGGRAGQTFRRIVLPLVFPAVVAGSIFTFSLTLGDYITPALVSNKQFIGNVVAANVGTAGNLPLAAAFATVPIAIMIVYLLVARRLGAFENL
jgi:putative spermidine/putrescine transport system permease protein